MKIRVNFYIKDQATKDKVSAHLADSSRDLADLMRQLMEEVIRDDRPIQEIPSPRIRTNVHLEDGFIDKFRKKLTELGAPKDCDMRDVMTILLTDYLEEIETLSSFKKDLADEDWSDNDA